MSSMGGTTKNSGFTIVELLVVIVVIAILAAISIVAYNGIQNRARDTAAAAELKSMANRIMTAAAVTGNALTPAEVIASSDAKPSLAPNAYNAATYCQAGNDYVVALQTKNGDTWYSKNGSVPAKDNTVSAYSPCTNLGVSGATMAYAVDPMQSWLPFPATACAGEQATCTFSGTKTVIFGSTAQNKFYGRTATNSVLCGPQTFGDPSFGVAKSCYVIQ